MGRTARGVRGIRLGSGHRLISLIIPADDGYMLTASENGYGKRTPIADFPVKGRGVQGVIAMQTSDRNGQVVGAVQVFPGDELMLISNMGNNARAISHCRCTNYGFGLRTAHTSVARRSSALAIADLPIPGAPDTNTFLCSRRRRIALSSKTQGGL